MSKNILISTGGGGVPLYGLEEDSTDVADNEHKNQTDVYYQPNASSLHIEHHRKHQTSPKRRHTPNLSDISDLNQVRRTTLFREDLQFRLLLNL